MGAAEGSIWLAYVLEPLGQGAGPGAAKKRGVGQAALTSEHYVRLPLSARGLSEEKKPPSNPHPQSIPSPASWGRHFPSQTLVEPSWSQVGISPLGSPSHPTPCHPQNLGFNVYFIIRMPAMREPPEGPSVGRWGTGKGHVYSLLPSPSPGKRRASQGRRGP